MIVPSGRRAAFEQQLPGTDVPEKRSAGNPHRDLVRGANLSIRAHPENLPSILETGDIRTQFETHSSGGMYAPEYRAAREKEMGFEGNPVYGYLHPQREHAEAVGSGDIYAQDYGEARFTTRPHVRDRATMISGDTLEADPDVIPAPIRAVESDATMLPLEAPMHDDPAEIPFYLEAQIHAEANEPHSRVYLDDDVSSLDFDYEPDSLVPRNPKIFPPVSERVEKNKIIGQQFQDRGISTWHNFEERTYQPPLPFAEEELSAQGFTRASPAQGRAELHRRPSLRGKPENIGRNRWSIHQNELP